MLQEEEGQVGVQEDQVWGHLGEDGEDLQGEGHQGEGHQGDPGGLV